MKRLAGFIMLSGWLLAVGTTVLAADGPPSCWEEVPIKSGNWLATGACEGPVYAKGGSTVTVSEGAVSLSSWTANITLASAGYTLLNQGSIINRDAAAVVAKAENQLIDNRAGATIWGGAEAINLGDNNRIINAGQIKSGGGDLKLRSLPTGITLGSGNTIDNSGVISAPGTVIQGRGNNTVNNLATGSLLGQLRFEGEGNVINNEGLITSTDVKEGVFLNSRTLLDPTIMEPVKFLLEPVEPPAEATAIVPNRLVNSGIIVADIYPVVISGSGELVNSGRIESRKNLAAIYLRADFSSEPITQNITLLEGSEVIGDLVVRSVDTKNGPNISNLTLDGNGQFDYAINGFTSLKKTGDGSWVLTGSEVLEFGKESVVLKEMAISKEAEKNPLGEIGWIGSVSVEGGRLDIDGFLGTGAFFIGEAGALGGSGAVASKGLGVVNKGTVAPGNSIGTLTIVGDYTHAKTATLEIEVGDGQSDLLFVSGKTLIEGGELKVVNAGSLLDGDSFSILQAKGGVSGAFDSLTDSLRWDFDLTYEDTQVLIKAIEVTYADLGFDKTDITIYEYLENAAGNGDQDAQALLELLERAGAKGAGELLGNWTPDQYPSLLDAGLMGFKMYGASLAGRMENLHVARQGEKVFYAQSTGILSDASPIFSRLPGEERRVDGWSGWARLLGMTGDMERDSSNQGFEFDSYGVSFGFDNQLSENLVLGVGLGYAESDVDFDTAGQSTDMDSYHVGVYTTYSTDKFYLDGALHYADNSYDSQRLEMGTGLKALSDTDGDEWGAFLGAGYTVFETDTLYFTPTISVAMARAEVDGFSEKGALLNQVISGYDADSLATTVGFRFGGKLGAQGNIRPELRLGWAHEFGDTERDIVASFAGSDSSFVIKGREPERDSVLLGLGLDARLNEKVAIYVDYDGEYQDDFDAHSLSLGLRYFF